MKEIKSREIIFNRQLVRFLMLAIIGTIVIFCECYFYKEDRNLDGLIIGIPLAVINFIIILISPIYYVFDENELIIKYFWGLNEIIPYKQIYMVLTDVNYKFWFPLKSFEIFYPHEEKFPLNSTIHKSRKTKRLLQYHTNLEIE
ncbi:MAG: hypothetical protein IKJ86_01205 [Clostridia bacterium]|jgi:hypothetical protein|nr:hypothetical protein [Clostridia bacterium]